MPSPHRLAVRVRYPESDPMGRLHHRVITQPWNNWVDCWAWWPLWYVGYVYPGGYIRAPWLNLQYPVFRCPLDRGREFWCPASSWHPAEVMGKKLDDEGVLIPDENGRRWPLLGENWDGSGPYHDGRRNSLWAEGVVLP